MSGEATDLGRWSRKQCPGCNLLVNFDRFTVVGEELRCIKCAPDDSEPWYVPSGGAR